MIKCGHILYIDLIYLFLLLFFIFIVLNIYLALETTIFKLRGGGGEERRKLVFYLLRWSGEGEWEGVNWLIEMSFKAEIGERREGMHWFVELDPKERWERERGEGGGELTGWLKIPCCEKVRWVKERRRVSMG